MSGLLFMAVVIAALVILDVLALRYGVDSRSESQDPRSPVRGISL
jgi:hypothetical protein